MLKKLIFLFFSAYILNIIASVQTKQLWHYQNHQKRDQNQIFFNGIISPPEIPSVQTPVVTSKKIDVAVNQEVKPIYWSTLLPMPEETFLGHDNSFFEKDLDILIYPTSKLSSGDFSYSITLPAGNTNDIIAAARNCNDKSSLELHKYNEENSISPQLKFNTKEPIKQNYRRNQYRNQNLNKQNKKRTNKHVVKDDGKKNNQILFSDPSSKRSKKKNGKATQHPYRNKKVNKSPQPCMCQCHKTKELTKESEYTPGKMREIGEKIINFDERSINLDDVLNINLEYADHDCQCIRNSRNNANTKNSRQKQYTMPNNFPIDYLNWIYNLVPYQQFGSHFQDNNFNFPYNLEALYKLSQEQVNSKKVSKNKKTKSPEKSPNRKRSNKKSSKKSKDKTNISDCDTLVELDPTSIEVEVFNEINSNEALIGKYTSNINSEEDSLLIKSLIKSTPVKNYFDTSAIINYITPKILEILPKLLETLPKVNEENYEFNTIPKIVDDNQKIIDIIPKEIETEPDVVQIETSCFEIVPETTETSPEINVNYDDTADNVELMNKFNHNNHEIDTPSVLNEHYSSKNEGFVIPLLPHDICFWDDYYPNFVADNGAYITSSEEEEWFNFHNQNVYFNDENMNKEILKRNLNRKLRPNNIELAIHSPNCAYMNKKFNKPNTKTKEAQFSSTNLEYPDFITRIINKEEIPSYIDVLKDKNIATFKSHPTHNSYKVQDIETIYAPSKVINYSVPPPYEDLPNASDKESPNKLYVREGDITIVYSTPFVTEYM